MTKTINTVKEKGFGVLRDLKKYLPKIPIPPLIAILTKNDKIVAMRKQYEAFLEEDKKRKQRNEYILGKLDTMRSCTTIVQRHRLPTIFVDEPCFLKRPTPSSSCHAYVKDDHQYKSQLSVPIKNIEDSVLLSEITKKYLLIPKRSINYSDINIDNGNTDIKPYADDNWQSKYEILNTLKQNEKEEPPEKLVEDILLANKKQHNITQKNAEISEEMKSGRRDLLNSPELLADKMERAEAKVVYNSLQNECNPEEKNVEIKNPDMTLSSIDKSQVATNPSESVAYYDPLPVEYENASSVLKNESELEYNVTEQSRPANNLATNLDDVKMNPVSYDNYNTYDDEKYNMTVLDNTDMAQVQFNNEVSGPKEALNVTDENIYQYPIEIINSDEFTPTEDVKLVDGVNVNPEGNEALTAHLETQAQYNVQSYSDEIVEIKQEETIPHNENEIVMVDEPIATENPEIDQGAIDAFEKEQSEMFYQEEGSNVAQGEVSEYAPNYEGDEQYLNYDSAQQGTGYPEINEHEETNERYDQMYEQQYNYEQPQQEQQQYDETGYEQAGNEQGYDQAEYPQQEAYDQGYQYDQDHLQQNYETSDHIQQQLDNEQGYNETTEGGYTEQTEQGYTEPSEQQGYTNTNEQTLDDNTEQAIPEKNESQERNAAKIANTEVS